MSGVSQIAWRRGQGLMTGSSSAPQLDYLISCLCRQQPRVQFLAVHIAGVRNTVAHDRLSRGLSHEVLAEVEAAGFCLERLLPAVEAGVVLSRVSALELRSAS